MASVHRNTDRPPFDEKAHDWKREVTSVLRSPTAKTMSLLVLVTLIVVKKVADRTTNEYPANRPARRAQHLSSVDGKRTVVEKKPSAGYRRAGRPTTGRHMAGRSVAGAPTVGQLKVGRQTIGRLTSGQHMRE